MKEENDKYYDVILIADCVWVEKLVLPLLLTLEQLVNYNGSESDRVMFLLSYQRRGKDAHDVFYKGLHERFDVIELEIDEIVNSFAMSRMKLIETSSVFYLFECRAKRTR